jgi:DegV family protein with EDD domain
VLCLTISSGLSGSMGAADQAQRNVSRDVHLLDSRTVSAAEAFQVHAVQTARERGHEIATALDWARQVADETELYFTIDTLEYLRRGGRIGRVQATLGGLLNLKPVVTVDKTTGTYTNVARARSWKGAIDAMADRVTAKFGAGTPLRLGLLYGDDSAYADAVLERLRERHPIVWHGVAPVGPALAVHTGPKAVGVAAAPGPWPWDR